MTTPPTTPSDQGTGVPTCYRHADRETYIRCQRCGRAICPDCMTEAAVGFQCPECVAEGRRTVRQARTPFGGAMPTGRAGVVTLTLIGLNLLVFALVTSTGGAASILVDHLALHARGLCVANSGGVFVGATSSAICDSQTPGTWVPGVADGAVWQLVTSMFLHVSLLHLGFNMLALYVLGPQLERLLGRVRFVGLYLLSGLAGSALVYWAAGEQSSTLGASGAVFGLMGALLVIAHKARGDYQQILLWIGLNFAFTVFGRSYISWQGHLGGFLGGLALAAILAYAPREQRTRWQAAGFSVVAIVVALAIVARTLTLS